MSWIEIIKVQTAERQAAEACWNFLNAFEHESAEYISAEISIYSHAAFSLHQLIHLHWHSEHPVMPSSKVSEMLIHELKQFGLVDHSIWTTGPVPTRSSGIGQLSEISF